LDSFLALGRIYAVTEAETRARQGSDVQRAMTVSDFSIDNEETINLTGEIRVTDDMRLGFVAWQGTKMSRVSAEGCWPARYRSSQSEPLHTLSSKTVSRA